MGPKAKVKIISFEALAKYLHQVSQVVLKFDILSSHSLITLEPIYTRILCQASEVEYMTRLLAENTAIPDSDMSASNTRIINGAKLTGVELLTMTYNKIMKIIEQLKVVQNLVVLKCDAIKV